MAPAPAGAFACHRLKVDQNGLRGFPYNQMLVSANFLRGVKGQ